MNPMRCGNHVYSSVHPSSRAKSSAILFSKPSPARLENGRLFGSSQTRSTRSPPTVSLCCAGAPSDSSRAAAITTARRGGRPAERTRRGRNSMRGSFGSSRPGRQSARPLRVRAVDPSYAAKGGGGEIRIGEIGAGEIGVDEVRAAQLGAGEVGAAHIGAAELRPVQFGAGQVGA